MAGAAQLSRAVLESGELSSVIHIYAIHPFHKQDPELVRPNHDLQVQLTIRKERLSFLIKFINDNAALTKVIHFRAFSMKSPSERAV